MNKYRFIKWLLLICLLFSSLIIGCERHRDEPIKVSLTKTEESTTVHTDDAGKPGTLKIAVSGIISPVETFSLYKELLDYISVKLAMPVEFVQRSTYAEVNNLVKDNKIDAAFVCSGAYVDGHVRFGMEALVAPVVNGESVYYSYIIVPRRSKAASLADLRGKRFAFTDPMSNTGKLAPTYMVKQLGADIDTFFDSYIFTHNHDRSIEMVAYGLVDGAAVDGLIWQYVNRKNPKLTRTTRIIAKSEPYGIPPFVVGNGMDHNLKINLRDLLLNMHRDPGGVKILKKLFIDKFIPADDRSYDSIRKMTRAIKDGR